MTPGLVDSVRETITRFRMLDHGDRVLCALSGGIDSTCLLHILIEIRKDYDLDIAAAHLNHGLRREAAAEASFVEALCATHGIPMRTASVDPDLYGTGDSSVQEIARTARISFLQKAALETGAVKIVTGHNRNDQAETVLINIFRGSGPRGLGGMKPTGSGKIIRPLIEVSREQIEDFMRERKLDFVEDTSNRSTKYLRNRIRLELIPALTGGYNPRIVESLARLASIVRDEDSLLDKLADASLEDTRVEIGPGRIALKREALRALEPALIKRTFRKAIESVKGDVRGISLPHVRAVIELVESKESGRSIDLPGGLRVEEEYDCLILSLKGGGVPVDYAYPLEINGVTNILEAGIVLRSEIKERLLHGSYPVTYPDGKREIFVDHDRLTGPLVVRNRRAGDRFRPCGLGGTKKLKDYFIDRKVPRRQRKVVPLVVSGEDIVWVVGHRPDGRFMIDEGTRKLLIIKADGTEDDDKYS